MLAHDHVGRRAGASRSMGSKLVVRERRSERGGEGPVVPRVARISHVLRLDFPPGRSAEAGCRSGDSRAYRQFGNTNEREVLAMSNENEATGRDTALAMRTAVDRALQCVLGAATNVKLAVWNVLDQPSPSDELHRFATLIEAAWAKPPAPELVGAVLRRPEAGSGAAARRHIIGVHLELGESRSGADAVAHQRSIERAPSCVWSVGTLGETALDRELAWWAITRLGVPCRGWLRLGVPEAPEYIERRAEVLDQWVADGRVEEKDVAPWRDAARRRLAGEFEEDGAASVSCRVWTRDRQEHLEMRAQIARPYGVDGDSIATLRDVSERLPRRPVVQRQVTFRLACEIGDAARATIVCTWCEENRRGVRWHACIHASDSGTAQGYYTAHVVWAQVEVEHWRDERGVLHNRLSVEEPRKVGIEGSRKAVALAPIARVLWGAAGSGGPRARDALIQTLRESIARLQNEALQAAHVRRRYDAGAGGNRGRDAEQRQRGGAWESSQTACTWQALGDAILETVNAEGGSDAERAALRERLRTELDVLRLLSGIDGAGADGPRLWEQLERQLSSSEPQREDAPAPVRWLRSARWTFSRAAVEPPGLSLWRQTLVEEPEGARVGAVAASIVRKWGADEAARLELDPRPAVRALLAQARRWERETAPWRERFHAVCAGCPTDPAQDTERQRLVEELEEHGLTLDDIAEKRDLMWVKQRERWLTGANAATEAQRLIGQCTEYDGILAEWHRWTECHGRVIAELGDDGKKLSAIVRTACRSARARVQWRAVAESREPHKLQRFAQWLVNEEKSPDPEEVTRRWNALEPGVQEEIRQCALDGADAAASTRAHRETVCTVASDRLAKSNSGYGDPGPLDDLCQMEEKIQWIRQFEPTLLARMDVAVERVRERRSALHAAGTRVGVRATESAARAQQVARLTPTQAARWVGVDPLLLRVDETPELWEEIERRLERFSPVVSRRITRARNQARAQTTDRDVGAVTSAGSWPRCNGSTPNSRTRYWVRRNGPRSRAQNWCGSWSWRSHVSGVHRTLRHDRRCRARSQRRSVAIGRAGR